VRSDPLDAAVRVIVISPQPALSLALSTQLPDCDAHAVSRIDDVVDLASDGSVVLLDVGPTEIDEWLSNLIARGLDTGMVVVGQPLNRVSRPNIQYLPRPFSLEELFSAFERVTDPPEDLFPERADPPRGAEPPVTEAPSPAAAAHDRDAMAGPDELEERAAPGPRTSAAAKATWDRAAQRLRGLISQPHSASPPYHPSLPATDSRPEPEPEFEPEPGTEPEPPAAAERPRSQLEPQARSVPEPDRTPDTQPRTEGRRPGPDPQEAGPGVGPKPQPEPESEQVLPAEAEQTPEGGESASPVLSPSVDNTLSVPAQAGSAEPAEESVASAERPLPSGETVADAATLPRAGWFKRRRAAARAADADAMDQGGAPMNAASFASRIREGLVAAHQLEGLLGDLAVLADVAQCGKALLEEINVRMNVGGSAVALRGTGDDLQIVATAADSQGVNDGHLTPDHPFVRAVESRGGAMLLSPTDEVRGLLAGVPLSHWPVLIAATIPGDGQPDGLVLVGQPPPADPTDVDRLYAIVNDAADLLRLAASLRRLPHPNDEHLNFLHTWMRREAP
jgi:hypothetical protein